jgi:hypothetical protein
MPPGLSAAELLEVWERGYAATPAARGLELLRAAHPDTPPRQLGEASLGWRDRELLALREGTFGSRMTGLADCPACAEPLELPLTVADLLDQAAPGGARGPSHAAEVTVTAGGHEVTARVPNTLDLVAVAGLDDRVRAGRVLLERCVLASRRDGLEVAVDQLPEPVADAVAERLAEADPQADVRVASTCVACGHAFSVVVDVAAFLWAEVEARAKRLALDVHVLAGAYGWAEADILALSPWRRELYLQAVRG